MNALIEVKVGESSVLLNPCAIAWASGSADGVGVAMMTGADETVSPRWSFRCSYDDFKRAWVDALNYDKFFGGDAGGIISV